MRLRLAAPAVAVAFLLAVPMARAESLGSASAKEKQRRKGKEPAKVITEEDLRRAGGVVSSPGSGSETTAPTSGATASGGAASADGTPPPGQRPKTDEEMRAEQSAAWRKKLDVAQANVALLEKVVASIEADLADLSAGLYTPRRAQSQTLLTEKQAELGTARQTLEALQDEGRRNRY